MGLFSFLTGRLNYVPEGRLTLMDTEFAKEAWKKIEEQVLLGKPSNLKSAVLDADKLVDFALKKMYPSLTTMGERLKEAKPKFINNYDIYDGLWFAHKVRNEIVHNISFELPSVEVLSILEKFKKALDHLRVL